MIPPRASARYAYDSSKITALKKKAPVSRLLPANTPERQLEKELNQAFAQPKCNGVGVRGTISRLIAPANCCSPEMKSTNRSERQKKRRSSRFRPRAQQQLRLEDFDDVRYTMESVRLGDDASGDAAVDRLALLESLFLALLGVLLLGGCVAVGFATHLLEYSEEALRWLLPMLLLPLAWVAALHLWERHMLTQQSKIATF
ncbi:hypothetical protein BBJ28_00009127 [Nothophytophthora sp. Chile5]|nr:hypothetical protein BBJ28_00009127 [Nothophytophthora sp. Chile5]